MKYYIIAGYLLLINLVAFFAFMADKRKAQCKKWRTPELFLMMTAVLGGGLGALAGMYCFRHKTNKKKFTVGIPLVLLLETALIIALIILL